MNVGSMASNNQKTQNKKQTNKQTNKNEKKRRKEEGEDQSYSFTSAELAKTWPEPAD